MVELSQQELLVCSEEDKALYEQFIYGLPKRTGNNGNFLDKYGVEIPYGSEAHVLQWIRKTIEIVKPNKILEIGLNLGWSSAMWLNLSDAYVFSIDISDKDETVFAGEYLKKKFGSRFNYEILSSEYLHRILNRGFFDLVFIDGAHDKKSALIDTQVALDFDIPYLLYDDTYSRYGEVAQAIAEFPGLKLICDMNNLKLYKNG